jgi:hypothetical protein
MIAAGSKRVLVTIPNEVKDWLQARAIYNGGTQSAEIVRSVRERMERETSSRTSTAKPCGDGMTGLPSPP